MAITRSQASIGGLVVFVLGCLVTNVTLLLDLHFHNTGRLTITEWAVGNGWGVWLLWLLTLVGPLGAAVHFIYFDNGGTDGDEREVKS